MSSQLYILPDPTPSPPSSGVGNSAGREVNQIGSVTEAESGSRGGADDWMVPDGADIPEPSMQGVSIAPKSCDSGCLFRPPLEGPGIQLGHTFCGILLVLGDLQLRPGQQSNTSSSSRTTTGRTGESDCGLESWASFQEVLLGSWHFLAFGLWIINPNASSRTEPLRFGGTTGVGGCPGRVQSYRT